MTSNVELLPLPSVLLNWPHPTNHAAIRDYARACVAHATAAKDAEIEALRAEVERWKAYYDDMSRRAVEALDSKEDAQIHAERLAEAGRRVTAAFRAHGESDWMDWNSTRDECEAAMLALDAALEQEAGR